MRRRMVRYAAVSSAARWKRWLGRSIGQPFSSKLMRLELASFPVAKVAYGDATRLDAGCLMISRDELARAVAHPAIAGVDVELTHPGESVRITQVSDVVEPRVKVSGGGDVFPGLLGPVEGVGAGRTHRLAGLAVMVCGEVPWLGASGLFVPRDNFVDTGGPGAEFTPHSWTSNVVLTLSFVDGL